MVTRDFLAEASEARTAWRRASSISLTTSPLFMLATLLVMSWRLPDASIPSPPFELKVE